MDTRMLQYETIWKDTTNLPWCALVTTGRVGSDFFQSLLDGHPEIYGFNGILFFHEFWKEAHSTKKNNDLVAVDIADEFVGKFIEKFSSQYDIFERKDELGENRDQSIQIDRNEFKKHLCEFLSFEPISRKNFLRAIYLSWALCLNQDISKKKIFFHHIHHIWKLDLYLEDYPDSKIISMTRDPRASYVSGVEHHRKYNAQSDHGSYLYFVLSRSIRDATELTLLPNDFRVLRLEDLGNVSVLTQVCQWLGISYDSCTKNSTWNDMRWWGDRVSTRKIPQGEKGFSPTITTNNWERKLGFIEKALLNYLLYARLNWFGYDCKKQTKIIVFIPLFFAILLPTRYELRMISPKFILDSISSKNPRRAVASYYYYLKRIILFYGLFKDRLFNKPFELPFFQKK